MATKYVLTKIKVNGELKELITKTHAENTTVAWNGQETTLTAALADILASITNLPTADGVDTKISAAIDDLIGGAPETYDTLKEIADYIAAHKDVADGITAAIGGKVDKEDGKGLSAEDFTAALKAKLEAMPVINAEQMTSWNAKADNAVATAAANGLMSKEDKARLDGLRGVRFGTAPPADMQDGELFVMVVNE